MIVPRVLIIAGSDSGGGAGIQADIKAVTMMGAHPMTAITAITAQNTLGVQAVMRVPAEGVLAQIDSVVSDIGVDAVKIGMIGSAETALRVAERLREVKVPIVFDPVMVATSGAPLADDATIAAFGALMDIATLVTPNLPELEALTGIAATEMFAIADAAQALCQRHDVMVLAKGGHSPDSADGRIWDLLLAADGMKLSIPATRVDTKHTHGTGCTLASAIAAGLALGWDMDRAVMRAFTYVQLAIRASPWLGHGHGPIGHALDVVPFELIHKKEW